MSLILDPPRTGVKDGSEPLCGYWELNPGPLQQQPVSAAEPSLQPLNFSRKDVLLLVVMLCVKVSECHVCAGTLRGQKRGPDPLEPELQAIASHQTQVLGPELRSSVRAARASNHSTLLPSYRR